MSPLFLDPRIRPGGLDLDDPDFISASAPPSISVQHYPSFPSFRHRHAIEKMSARPLPPNQSSRASQLCCAVLHLHLHVPRPWKLQVTTTQPTTRTMQNAAIVMNPATWPAGLPHPVVSLLSALRNARHQISLSVFLPHHHRLIWHSKSRERRPASTSVGSSAGISTQRGSWSCQGSSPRWFKKISGSNPPRTTTDAPQLRYIYMVHSRHHSPGEPS